MPGSVVRSIVHATVVLLIAAVAAPMASAQAIFKFDMPAQPLAEALRSVGRETNTNVLFEPTTVKGLDAPELRAELTTEEAIRRLLIGTKLDTQRTTADTIVVQRASEANQAGRKSREARTTSALSNRTWPLRLVQVDQSNTAGDVLLERRGDAPQPATTGLEEIVVTAQKREERLADVPISMSVMSGAELDRSTAEGITGALSRVPGVATTAALQGGGTQVAIRGVTAGGPLFNGSSPIAYYLDSVPFGLVKTAVAPDSNAYDLERVEVLRGPQGTLYGASAQNGVVRVLTKDADLDDFELKTRTSLSSTEHGAENYRGDVALNVPVVEGKLAVRAVVGYENLGGWIDKPNADDVNDAQLRNYRLKVNAQPTDELAIGFSAWLSRSDHGAPSASDENHRRSSVADESLVTDYDAYGLKVRYDFKRFSVSSMTSYLDYGNGGELDLLPFVGVPFMLPTQLESAVWSEEILVNSAPGDTWLWSVGGIYRDAEDRLLQAVATDFTDTSKSFALFGEVTRLFMQGQLELTGGLRYFEDDVTQIENFPGTGVPTDPLLPPQSRTFDATSPRIVLSWHPTFAATVYASYAEGFRSGFNQNANIIRARPEFPPVDADNLRNYELGAKGDFLDDRVSYELAVFFIDWQDVQQTISVPINGLPTTVVVNGESASGFGAEVGLSARPVDGLQLGVSFSWNDLTWDSELTSVPASLFDAGDRLNFSPKYNAGASAQYEFGLGSGGYRARFAASANYNSEQTYRNLAGITRVTDIGESMLIARAGVSLDAPEHWTATLFVDNINDESDPGVGLFNVPEWPQRVRPRTVGLQFEYRL